MKTFVFTPPDETGRIVTSVIPNAGSRDTRLGRESSRRKASSGTISFQAALGVKGFVRAQTGRHWFRLMSDTHERFCWTTRLCRVMLLHRGICLSLGGDYDFDPYAVSLL